CSEKCGTCAGRFFDPVQYGAQGPEWKFLTGEPVDFDGGDNTGCGSETAKYPGTHVHRGRWFERTHHVQEAFWTPEVENQKAGTTDGGGYGGEPGIAPECLKSC